MSEHLEDRGVQLMLAFQAGDDAAFEALVEMHSAAVFGLLRRLLGPGAELEDLAQEAFLRLFRSRDRYRPEGRLGTFLYRIVYNLALNRLRDQRRHPQLRLPTAASGAAVDLEDEAAEGPHEGLDAEVWRRRLAAALSELPENQRVALVLQHYDELDLEEIGAVLAISAKAVKSLLHRARENLRQHLAPFRTVEDEN